MIAPWDPETDDTLVCVATRDETHDVRTFVLSAVEPRRFVYQPGQFMTFAPVIDGAVVERSYTLSSTPTRPDRVSITVKRQAGVVSGWLHANLSPGSRIRAHGPLGDFTNADDPRGLKYLFISGGSGITPLMSMARASHDLAAADDIAFVHCARTPADVIFYDELRLMARAGTLHPTMVVETATGFWPGYVGRMSLPMLRLIAPDLMERDVLCCGPAPFMAAIRAMLTEAGHPPTRYRQESFDFSTLIESAPPIAATETATWQIAFTRSGVTAECDAQTTVLVAARRAGIAMQSGCTHGLCGTCKSKLTAGTVEMNHQGGIRKREIDAGLFLPCCSTPTSDIAIDR